MAKAVLSDGRELEPDLSKISLGEWRRLFDPETTLDEEDELVARVFGITVDEMVNKVSQPDYRRLNKALLEAGTEPLADPNSQSASTSGLSDGEASHGNTGDGNSSNDSDGPSSK